MEETLGKRIVHHRKRLGLTQDALAEKLGVTAQAVSKWENDQSCPDITMLPKLAEIFGTTTDALLGITRDEPVRESTVEPAEPDDEVVQFKNGNWEFKYDNSRRSSLMLAVTVLLVGALYLIVSLLRWDAGLWDITWPSVLLVFGLFGIYPEFSFFRLGVGLIGGYFLADNLFPLPFGLDHGAVLAIVLLLFGGALLVKALRKPRKRKVQFTYNGNPNANPTQRYHIDGDSFCFNGSFGDQYQFVEMNCLSKGEINTSFGDYTVDLTGIATINDGCEIDANVSFGNLTVKVPVRYLVRCESSVSFASVDVSDRHGEPPAGIIRLNANSSFGEITVEYI